MDLAKRSLLRGRFRRGTAQTTETQARAAALRAPWLISESLFFDRCTRCSKCIDSCAEGVLKRGDGGFPEVDFQTKELSLGDSVSFGAELGKECTFCGECADACPESLFFTRQQRANYPNSDIEPWNYSAQITKDSTESHKNNACMVTKGIVCHSCKEVCDVSAINMEYNLDSIAEPNVNDELCTGCGACVSVCPTNAISIYSPSSS